MEKGKIPVTDRVAAVLTNLKVEIGARCSVLRRRLNLTLADVSKETGLHVHRISEMERGERDVSREYVRMLEKHKPEVSFR